MVQWYDGTMVQYVFFMCETGCYCAIIFLDKIIFNFLKNNRGKLLFCIWIFRIFAVSIRTKIFVPVRKINFPS